MASLPHHLPSRLLLLLFSLLYTFNGDSANPSNPACPSYDCGNGVTISYPFWHNDKHFEYCGYPGFGLSCAHPDPVIHLCDDVYHVKKINYSEHILNLAYIEANEQSCPRAPHNVTQDTSSSLFHYSTENKMLHFFYNCTLYPPSPPSIECLRYGNKRSYVFMVGEIPEFDWYGYCESILTVPVVDTGFDGVTATGFGGTMQEGFKLTWQSDRTCRSCEETGGFCGYSNDFHRNFFCFCWDGRHPVNCRENGVVAIQNGPNFAAIGALVFGILITAATILYVIQRKKLHSSYNPISSLLPNNRK